MNPASRRLPRLLSSAMRNVCSTGAALTLIFASLGAITAGAQQVTFSQQHHSTGVTPVSVAVADFNGDGLPDVAIALRDQRMVEIRLQQPGGTYNAGQQFMTCGNPVKVVVGDFNHDGKMDVAALNAKGTT